LDDFPTGGGGVSDASVAVFGAFEMTETTAKEGADKEEELTTVCCVKNC